MTKKLHVGIGISGGIAGYKVIDLVQSLKAKNIRVSVIMTDSAVKMFGKKALEAEAGGRIYNDLIPRGFNYKDVLKDKKVEHISLADSLDLLVIAPATANIMAKIANGIADDYLTTLILSVTCRILIAPSMNTNMWNNSITQNNLKKLRDLSFFILNPDKGELACGYIGIGRLANIKEIENNIVDFLDKKNQLRNMKVLVTAGATVMPIDSVRHITNRASGKMGKYLSQEAVKRGAQTLLLRGETSASSDFPVFEKTFRTNDDLADLMEENLRYYDIIFHSASVSDFYSENLYKGKIKSSKPVKLFLKPAEKLIDKIKKLNKRIILVGFKAVVGLKEKEIEKIGKEEIEKHNEDYLVVNDVGRRDIGFESDYNEVYLITKSGKMTKFNKQKKEIIASKIMDAVIK